MTNAFLYGIICIVMMRKQEIKKVDVSSWKHSIKQIHESSGNLGVSPNLITARQIASVEGDDALYEFLFDLTGMTKEDFKNRIVNNVATSRKEYEKEKGKTKPTDTKHIKQRIEELREFLEYHEKLYYTQPDKVEISDYEYDMKMKELENLESQYPQFAKKDSPSVRVGYAGSQTQAHLETNLEKL